MGRSLTEKDINEQSIMALSQSRDRWEANARANGERYKKAGCKVTDLLLQGWGKALVVVGMGASLEDDIETIAQYQDKPGVDVCCCDKGLGPLLTHGIKPDFVFLADANVDYDRWCKPYVEQTKDIKLISSVTANPLWSENWKGPVYYYVNKDNIQSEEIFIKASGCRELIPASSNVGNTAIVFMTQTLGYSEYLLVGYDFSWVDDGNYYAFNDEDKRYYMRVIEGVDAKGRLFYTSSNLMFSCRWLQDFVNIMLASRRETKIFDCSKRGILDIRKHDLGRRLARFEQRFPTPEITRRQMMATAKRVTITPETGGIEKLRHFLKKMDVLSIDLLYRETADQWGGATL